MIGKRLQTIKDQTFANGQRTGDTLVWRGKMYGDLRVWMFRIKDLDIFVVILEFVLKVF